MRAGLAVPGKIAIRPMTKAEVGTAIDRADREGWNPHLSDGEGCNTFGPRAFSVVPLDGRLTKFDRYHAISGRKS